MHGNAVGGYRQPDLNTPRNESVYRGPYPSPGTRQASSPPAARVFQAASPLEPDEDSKIVTRAEMRDGRLTGAARQSAVLSLRRRFLMHEGARMTATRMRFLCEACAEGLGLELDGAKLVRAVCAMCGQRCNCIVATRPADEGNGGNGYEKDCGIRNRRIRDCQLAVLVEPPLQCVLPGPLFCGDRARPAHSSNVRRSLRRERTCPANLTIHPSSSFTIRREPDFRDG
jgi:hypothetical protein